MVNLLVATIGLARIKRPSRDDWNRVWDYFQRPAFFFSATYALIFLYERIDQILILHYFDLATLGIYFVCYKMSFSVRLLSTIIVKAAYPLMSRVENNDAWPEAKLETFLLRVNYIIATVSAVGLCLGADFLLGLYGEQYVALRSVLMIMAVTRVAAVVNLVLANIINAKGEGGQFFKISLSTVLLQVIFLVATVGFLGIKAMALSRLVAVFQGNILSLLAVRRLGRFDPIFLRMSLKFTLFSVGMAVAQALSPGWLTSGLIVVGLVVVLGEECRELWILWIRRQEAVSGP